MEKEKDQRKYNYQMVRIVCGGKIKSCDFCKDVNENKIIEEGYCKMCGRPLYKKPGESCGFVIGYVDRNYRQQDKVHFICRFCNTITTK